MNEGLMSCGHPIQAATCSDEGTNYCRWCEEVARLKDQLEAEKTNHELTKKHRDVWKASRQRAWDEYFLMYELYTDLIRASKVCVPPKIQEKIAAMCGKGIQWCNQCTEFECGDNTNKDKP